MRESILSKIFAITGACAALVLTSCHSGSPVGNGAATPSARVATAQRGDITRVLSLAGQFQPYQTVDVHPKVSGYMKKINVDIGDIVHEGQTLAVLEVPELKAESKARCSSSNRARKRLRAPSKR